jgi:hypothetical protein
MLKRNSKNRTRGLRMNDMSVEIMRVRTRSGKKEAIQNPKIINPTITRTFMNGLLDVV